PALWSALRRGARRSGERDLPAAGSALAREGGRGRGGGAGLYGVIRVHARPLQLLLALALPLAASRAAAQVGTTTDIITGTVSGPDSLPLAGALVQAVSLETQISRHATTDARGRFTIVFPDGGGQYDLTIRFIGMATANAITLDGLSLGGGSVPQDAIRSTRVVTSSYDAARGQFSGGLVASTTRSGKNIPQGSFTYTLRDRSLAWGQVTNSAFGQGYTQNQLSGGMGGPIVRNRLFVFGALQGRWRGQALPSLVSADPATLARLGVSPDSAARFLALA